MPHFGTRSRERRDTCHPDLILVLDDAILVNDFAILCGVRGKDEQDQAFADGLSNALYGQSPHNTEPSVAFDAAPWFSARPHIHWEDELGFAELNGVFRAVAHRLRVRLKWGKDFVSLETGKPLRDLNHWELDLS